jgi:AcrR family transcriptional regulator
LERKKRLTAEHSEKREAILKATLDLLVERGFHDTPTALIAKEAGVATGTLFHHFKNKEELINALYLETKSKMINALKKEIQSTGSIEEKMRQVWKSSVQWGIMHPKEFQFFQQYANSPFITKLTRDEAMNQFEFIHDMIEEAIESESVKNIYQEFFMDYFEGMFVLGMNHFRKHPQKISEENMNMMFDVCWNGLSAK